MLFCIMGVMVMKRGLKKYSYYVLAILVIIVFYLIFNAGNPRSLLRLLIKDPSYDVTITVVLSLFIVVISIFVASGKEDDPIKHMLDINTEHIKKLRNKGKSEVEIAESFLKEIGVKRGLLYPFIKRRVLRYLSKID